MRNSEAQRYARWSAAAAGVLAVIVAGVYIRNVWRAHQEAKKAPPAVPSSVEQQSNEFSFSKVEGQRTIYTVRASRTTEFKEGNRNLLEDVEISVYGKAGGRNDTLRTQACDFISNTGEISCAGEVQISLEAAGTPHASANAIQVATSGVTFDRDSGEARTDKPVKFHWTAGQGQAIGARYDSNSGTLFLEHSVELNISTASSATQSASASAQATEQDASSHKTLRLTGDTLAFQQEARKVQVNGNVRAQQATRQLSAGTLLLELDDNFHARRLVAGGDPQLSDSDVRGPMELNGDEIVSVLKADGSVESITATGDVHGARRTAAGEEGIEAGRVQMDLASRQNYPRLLTASNGVTLTSTSATSNGGTRRVQSNALEIHFSIKFQPGQTLLESVNTLAPASIEWRNVSTVNGKPVPQILRMSGKQMNLKFDGENQLRQLISTDGVQVARKLGEAPEQTTASRDLTANFDDTGQWSTIDQTGDVRFDDGQRKGQGDRAHVDRFANEVTLAGSVEFADAATRTVAQTATFTQSSNLLRAEGHVLTTGLRADSDGVSNFAQEPAHVTADSLVADTSKNHAIYSGHGRLWQGESVIDANTIELDGPSHTLVAKGNVQGVFPQAPWNPRPAESAGQSMDQKLGGRKRSEDRLGHVRGGLLTYWERESRARIEQNGRVDSEQGSIQADRIDMFFSSMGAGNATKQLSSAVATGDVAVHQEDRRGTSNRAEYTAAEGKFVLSEGKPTLYSSTGDTTTGRQLTFYFADDRIVVDSEDGKKTVTLHRVEK
jgi:lipopolysaccharide export system protein LptA